MFHGLKVDTGFVCVRPPSNLSGIAARQDKNTQLFLKLASIQVGTFHQLTNDKLATIVGNNPTIKFIGCFTISIPMKPEGWAR